MPDPRPGPSRRSFRILLGLFVALLAANMGYLALRMWSGKEGMHRFSGDRQATRTELFLRLPPDSGAIVLLGDSHLEHFPIGEFFPGLPVVNRGVSASTLRDVADRARIGCGPDPALIVVHAGINDLFKGRPVERFEADLVALLDTLRAAHPDTPVVLDELLPTADRGMDPAVRRCNEVLHRLAAEYGVTVLPLYADFGRDGTIDPARTYDGVHLTAEGYERWAAVLRPVLLAHAHTP